MVGVSDEIEKKERGYVPRAGDSPSRRTVILVGLDPYLGQYA